MPTTEQARERVATHTPFDRSQIGRASCPLLLFRNEGCSGEQRLLLAIDLFIVLTGEVSQVEPDPHPLPNGRMLSVIS